MLRYGLTFIGLLGALSEKSMHNGVVIQLYSLGVIVGGVIGAMLLLLLLRYILRHSHLALRVGSTFLTVGTVIAVPIILTNIPLSKILLVCMACGYLVAALTRIPLAFGHPRGARLAMQAYDYMCGGLLLGLCCVLSVPQFCRQLQTKSLLSAVFERRVAHTEIMRMLDATA